MSPQLPIERVLIYASVVPLISISPLTSSASELCRRSTKLIKPAYLTLETWRLSFNWLVKPFYLIKNRLSCGDLSLIPLCVKDNQLAKELRDLEDDWEYMRQSGQLGDPIVDNEADIFEQKIDR